MATNKLGTLVYDLVADTKDFQQGLVQAGRPLTALKKLFIESRTPLEAFGIQLQGMRQLIMTGAQPINMFSRSIADLAVNTKGGVREARQFSESLRSQAREIESSAGGLLNLSTEQSKMRSHLFSTAKAIDDQIASTIRSRQESERNAATLQRINLELKKRIARERELDRILSARRKKAKQQAISQGEQVEAQRTSRVRAMLEETITPQQKLTRAMADAREELRRGNITRKEFTKIQGHILNKYKQLKNEMIPLGKVVEKTRGRLERFGEGMVLQVGALARQISAISAAYAVIDQIRKGISGALELGRSTKEFEIFTDSAETARAMIAGLRNLAAETPLTMGASTQTARTLLQYGVAQDRVLDITRRLGDVSGASTERLQRLALAMGQITANGRLQGQELRQLIESGFNPLQLIAKQTGQDMMEMRIQMSEGRISAEQIRQALIDATSEGGRFADQLKRIGEETPAGKILKLQGAIEKLRTEAFMPTTVVLGNYAQKVTNFLKTLRGIGRFMSDLRETNKAFARSVENALQILGAAGFHLRSLQKLLGLMTDIETMAKEYERAQIEASASAEESISEVNKSIVDRIATLRNEREEIRLGKEEFEILDAVRQGASDEYIAKLRKELELTRKVREEDERRNEAAKKAKKIIAERDENEKWWKDWFRNRRHQPQLLETAQQFADLIATPFDKLVHQLRELRGVADMLDEATMRAAEQKLKDQFIKSQMEKDKRSPATAATRGSVEEFRLLRQISAEGDTEAERRHKEQLLEQQLQNKNLGEAKGAIENLPEELASTLEEFFATPVA